MSRKLFTKILKGGRINLPKEIMEQFDLQDGTFVIFEAEGNHYIKIIPAMVVEK